ncbi:hypothetical protein GBA52_016686 [Prunus armeniaca]|nr:hypothetical protein GBA52_016686 [Prunus armeniaca]
MGMGTSTFVIRWINFLTMLLAIAVVVFGVWMSTHHDNCRRSLTLPVIGIGAVIFFVSIIGFLGALKNSSILLWIYLILLCFISVGVLVFTVLAFIVTNNGSGHSVAGLRLECSHKFQLYFFRRPLFRNKKKILSLSFFFLFRMHWSARIGMMGAINIFLCGYPAVNASYYDMSFHPVSSNKDCKLYKNARDIKCYNCDSCKAGVAQYMKTEWRVVAIFNVALFVVLVKHSLLLLDEILLY